MVKILNFELKSYTARIIPLPHELAAGGHGEGGRRARGGAVVRREVDGERAEVGYSLKVLRRNGGAQP